MTLQIGTATSYRNQNLEISLREIESCIQDHNRIVELLSQLVLSRPELGISDEIKGELLALVRRSSATVASIRRLSNR